MSGVVRVNQSLDYSTIARYHTTVKAVDNAGSADQTATGRSGEDKRLIEIVWAK